VETHRALVFLAKWQSPSLDWLLGEFRLLVNESIRIALSEDIRSRARLTRAAYQVLSRRHMVHKKYIPSAFEVALAVLKVHRRRLKRGKRSSVPYMRKLMLKAENSPIGSTARRDDSESRSEGRKAYSSTWLFPIGIVCS